MDVKGNMHMEGSQLNGEEEGEKEKREAVMFICTLQELSRNMEAIEAHKVQEDQSETSAVTEQECMCYIYLFTLLYLIPTFILF